MSVVLLDADGNLFPSEEPAFAASVNVTNRFLEHLGVPTRYTAEELRTATTGKNFRTTAVDLAAHWGVPIHPDLARRDGWPSRADDRPVLTAADLEYWVGQECDEVTAYLGEVLRPDPDVLLPLHRLHRVYRLAAVSSSALMRLKACFSATGLDDLVPEPVRFSAEDSLPVPTSKPDPAVYRYAVEALGIAAAQAVAIEDSVPGVASAVAAGVPTIGNLVFVPVDERAERRDELAAAGACAVTDSWHDIAALLTAPVETPAARSM
ncbi:HAD family hydrolase [Mycolicibacterium vaccae]|uniref:HAD family hydrolase n=1 Tax=Mycolicibacterium vaccae TaxID=1810 RepID=UPI003CEEA1DA